METYKTVMILQLVNIMELVHLENACNISAVVCYVQIDNLNNIL